MVAIPYTPQMSMKSRHPGGSRAHVTAVPDVVPERLLSPSPPHRHNDQHGRRDGSLESTHDESKDGDSGETPKGGHDGDRS